MMKKLLVLASFLLCVSYSIAQNDYNDRVKRTVMTGHFSSSGNNYYQPPPPPPPPPRNYRNRKPYPHKYPPPYYENGVNGDIYFNRQGRHSNVGVGIHFNQNNVYSYPYDYPSSYSVYRDGYVAGYNDGTHDSHIIDREEIIYDGNANRYECQLKVNSSKYIAVATYPDIAKSRAIENCMKDWDSTSCYRADVSCNLTW